MRVMLSLLIGLMVVGSVAAQTGVPPDQCLGGRLFSIQQDSITLQFNDKVTTMPIAPDAEIWRRGVDLESIRELAPGDDVYLKCVRPEASGPVMAAIIAVAENEDGLNLVPHHITAIGACSGELIAATSVSVTVKNEKGSCKVQTNAQTTFWRGQNFPDATGLKLGDRVDIRYAVGYPGRVLTAESVEANVAKCEGTVVDEHPGLIVVKEFRPRDRCTVYFDPRTRIMDPDNDNESEFARLKKKTTVLAVGLDLGHNSMRATTIYLEK
jgi:Domain of unknown function (DUF5666)